MKANLLILLLTIVLVTTACRIKTEMLTLDNPSITIKDINVITSTSDSCTVLCYTINLYSPSRLCEFVAIPNVTGNDSVTTIEFSGHTRRATVTYYYVVPRGYDSEHIDIKFFLNDNEEVGFVGAECMKLYPDGRLVEEHEIPAEGTWMRHGDVFKYAVKGPVIRTATLCFRRSLIVPYLSLVGAGNDTILQAILAKQSHFARWTLPTSVYRLGGVSNAKKSLQKELIYQDYFSTNRRLKHKLFPEECPLDEDALSDRGANILLKMAIKDRDWKKALTIKSGLKTEKYRKKPYVKFLLGPVSCFFLSIIIRRKYD